MEKQITFRSTITVTAVAAVRQAMAIVPAAAQTVLKFAWQLPLTNYASKGAERMAHASRTNPVAHQGRNLSGRSALSRAALYEAARNGAVDLAMFALGSFATTDPLTDIVYLPFVVPEPG